jgi:lipoprotein-releasing system permease protein
LNFPFYIAKRYLFAKSSNNAINIITIIASLGVIVGTAALFIILSGFSGLRTFNDTLLETSDPDIKVTPVKGKSFVFSEAIEKKILSSEGLVDFSPTVEERVFLKSDEKQQIAYMKGVDYNYIDVVKLDSAIVMGRWLHPSFPQSAVLGNGLAYRLSMGIANYGKPLEIVVPKTGTGFMSPNSTRSIRTQIIGLYTGTEDFQNKYVFVSNEQAQYLLDYEADQFSALEIKINPEINPDAFAENLKQQLGPDFKVQTKAQLNELFYKVINTENFVSYLIFTLIMIIAMFNVIGAMIMMIIDKKENLKTIFNLGATLRDIKRIFVLQGFLLTVVGMGVGLVLAVILVFLQQTFEWFMLTSTVPYPAELHLSNFFIVLGTITVLGLAAAQIASSRISIRFLEN